VVDDNSTNRKLLRLLLGAWGARCAEVDNAESAIHLLRTAAVTDDPYRLVLLDYHMPGKDGVALSHEVHALLGEETPPMVLLTSHSERPSRPELDDMGIAACMFKPLRKQSLFECLREVIGPARQSPRGPLAGELPTRESAMSGMGALRVLVAEDNIVNQKVALLHLKRLGVHAEVAPDGRAAVAAVERCHYDIVFMDCQMPELDGFAATRLIREHEARSGHPRLPIVAMTAGAVMGDRENCLAAGMDDYMSKPVRWEELRAIIHRHLPHLAPAVA
jgi:two-component system, sensor histidine kinase and response regulator